MIKNFLLFIVFSIAILPLTYAQDSSAYELQRAKINALLAERSAKFGQYDESLNARTGIFGFQTKRDIKNSNEILRQIALNDNEIFTQLKVLMDYKDVQAEQIRSAVNSNAENIVNYRKTIKSLQDQNQILSDKQDKLESARDLAYLLMTVFLIICAILGYVLYSKIKQIKQNEKATF